MLPRPMEKPIKARRKSSFEDQVSLSLTTSAILLNFRGKRSQTVQKNTKLYSNFTLIITRIRRRRFSDYLLLQFFVDIPVAPRRTGYERLSWRPGWTCEWSEGKRFVSYGIFVIFTEKSIGLILVALLKDKRTFRFIGQANIFQGFRGHRCK